MLELLGHEEAALAVSSHLLRHAVRFDSKCTASGMPLLRSSCLAMTIAIRTAPATLHHGPCLFSHLQAAAGEKQHKVLIAVSSPLAWAATPPLPPAPAAANRILAEGDVAWQPAYSEADEPARQPAACAAACARAEHALLRAARPGQLAVHVVLPGVLYGSGEDDSALHGLFKAAWLGNELQLVGSGANLVPTLHVRGLAAYVAALAEASTAALRASARLACAKGLLERRALHRELACGVAVQQQQEQQQQQDQAAATSSSASLVTAQQAAAPQPPPPCLMVADSAPVKQAALVAAISTVFGALGAPSIERVSHEAVLLQGASSGHGDCAGHRALLQQMLDLPLRSTPLAPGAPLPAGPRSRGGLLDCLDEVAAELVAARRLEPLRLLVRGPPASGKSHLAARLARHYCLPLISSTTILAEAAHCDVELQKVGRVPVGTNKIVATQSVGVHRPWPDARFANVHGDLHAAEPTCHSHRWLRQS